jgi:3-oxoacyl-[acyl-carrier protein] reductase
MRKVDMTGIASKVALVTGGSRGIGAACVRALAREGYKIAFQYLSNEEKARQICESIPEAKAYCFDLSKDESCSALIQQVKTDFGRIDVLVNNAGIALDQVITFAKPEDFTRTLDTNLKPVFLLSKIVSRLMIKQKNGAIINLTSIVGHTGNPGQVAYAASKSAITGLTKSMAYDLAGFGIRCNCVAPGFIDTDMTSQLSGDVREQFLSKIPLKRLGKPEEIADAVCFLASERASYITGSTIHVNGGMYTN